MRIMVAAGEESGDALAAELIHSLRETDLFRSSPRPPQFFGAGGAKMAQAGVERLFDLTDKATVGLWEVVANAVTFKRSIDVLTAEAIFRQPELIIVVDNSGFNLRLARAIKQHVRLHEFPDGSWRPQIVYYISPQVWASRPHRVKIIEENIDLLLSIFPFEREWYRTRAPRLKVEFVGHPLVDRYPKESIQRKRSASTSSETRIVLLPGSRTAELQNHLPVLAEAVKRIRRESPARFLMVLPNAGHRFLANHFFARVPGVEIQVGGLAEALQNADFAISSSGTVTLECAWFEVPTVVLYKCSWLTYQAAKRLVTVPRIAMPNILADEELFPEFIQSEATAEAISRQVLKWIHQPEKRGEIQEKLKRLNATLGEPGACHRAARAITKLWLGQSGYWSPSSGL